MRVLARLPAMQARAESLMLDTFTPYSPDASAVTYDENGFQVAGYAAQTVTLGRITGSSAQTSDTTARTVDVGGIERPVISGGLHIPVGAAVPTMGEYGIGWEYVLTTLGEFTDASLLNSRWLVIDAPAKSFATARRLDVVRLV